MKVCLWVIFFLCACVLTTSAQLTANAGPDKVYCVNADNDEDPVLGADTVVYGGTPPYTYKWEAHDIEVIGPYSWHFFASDFLDDTTAANPTMIYSGSNDETVFRLTVTDADNQVSVDTVVVRKSFYTFTLDSWEFTINQVNQFTFNGVQGSYSDRPPFDYYWHPTHGLDDSTSEMFWAHPDYSIRYYCKMTDALGCYVDVGRYMIYVIPVGTNDLELNSVSVFPNPSTGQLNFNLGEELNQIYKLNIYDLNGKIILHYSVKSSAFTIDVSMIPTGKYMYQITGDGNKIYSGIFVKE